MEGLRRAGRVRRAGGVRRTRVALLACVAAAACHSAPAADVDRAIPARGGGTGGARLEPVPRLRPVGSRGFFALDGPFASFDPEHPSVEVWVPDGAPAPPVVVYAHGGAGFREDDQARVAMFRRHGFATISFDSYEMNGFNDWEFVTRRVTNRGKQDMILGVFEGAVRHALGEGDWDNENLVFYGGSNGGRVVLHAGSALPRPEIRAIVSEAPAATGLELGDLTVPTLIPFGALDNWAGRSGDDFVWTRTFPSSPVSLEAWVRAQKDRDRDVRFIFYENAGHLLFEGPLKEVTVRRGDAVAFTAYEGAAEGVLEQYEQDVLSFVRVHLRRPPGSHDQRNRERSSHAIAPQRIEMPNSSR